MTSTNYKTYNRVYNIFVEGCIGEGKSTLCKNLKKVLEETRNCIVVTSNEVVDTNLLKEFYKNQKAIMPAFQASMITSRISQKIAITNEVESKLDAGHKDIYIINDTGFFSDQVFINTGFEYGNMDTDVVNMLSNLRLVSNNSASRLFIKPTHVFLLSSTPQKCISNIKMRSEVDTLIAEDYMEILHRHYRQYYRIAEEENPDVKFITIDTKTGFAIPNDILDMI